MEKLYNRIDWHNNTSPDINETNLNRMSKAIDDIDDRVVDIAGTVMETVPQIQEDLAEAQELIEDAEELTTHPPIIGQNGHWWTWDTSIDDYADSGVDAGVSLTIGTTSTLTPGSDATVTNSGTATDPILNFGIPAGVAGQNGQDGADGADGTDGVSPTVTIGTITGGHSVTITDADHPTGQTFNVMDGTNGQGVPASGTTGQVLTKASNADYDTTWTTPSGGSGGHTILNGSGSAMNQRGKLQFDGLNVTDDSGNDKTVVKSPIFNGTTAQWTALSSAEKAKYTVVNLTDDYSIKSEVLADSGMQTLTADSYHRLVYSFTKNTGMTNNEIKEKYSHVVVTLYSSATNGSNKYGISSQIYNIEDFIDITPTFSAFVSGDNIWKLTEGDTTSGRPFFVQANIASGTVTLSLQNYEKSQTSLKLGAKMVGILR